MKIAMWSGPRNLSTALMYSFAARGDCAVWDEPFYAAYLRASGINHPMRDTVIAAGEANPELVAAACIGPTPGDLPIHYQKHMTLHMLPEFPRDWMHEVRNVFLIRHPARVVASYAAKREAPTADDIGFRQQAELFDAVADWTGTPPLVVDSGDVRSAPAKTLGSLCAALGIPWTERMLRWPEGPKPYDGAWAPHWYNAVHRSTRFDGAEGPVPELTGAYADLAHGALPHYQRLAAFRLR